MRVGFWSVQQGYQIVTYIWNLNQQLVNTFNFSLFVVLSGSVLYFIKRK